MRPPVIPLAAGLALGALVLYLVDVPREPEPDLRGTAGHACNRDGTCNGPRLECRNPPMLWGMPIDEREPTCWVRVGP